MEMEFNFCRRCGTKLMRQNDTVYNCKNGHTSFNPAPPAVGVLLLNAKDEVLLVTRAVDPGKGKLDMPGGFCDAHENLLGAVHRELREEIGLDPRDYSEPLYLTSELNLEYMYQGERKEVLDIVFWARLVGTPKISSADDVADAAFWPLNEIDTTKIFQKSLVIGLELLRQKFQKLKG